MALLTTKSPVSLMADGVAAEVLDAAGLGDLCVGENDKETLDRQARCCRNMHTKSLGKDNKRRAWNVQYSVSPLAWKAPLKHYI